ncbi:LysR family transcriptional regulator [Gluconacetobacter liquefaciens]|uniref:DNA-binding transcriptional LysR family regulator n=1 Tax=Gluconacetobacter liquefaciens TaxID=89584 RepID=A0A370FVG6_GLULI|nr:LysR family transcriptional regulator [Gluconacetobacter liquefaciens]MBB2187340.1 LysR family transcriptional regulator [Gluconacetobacter liquefaciens]RDI35505.1 DNA-binding transcriptional LysR family regulator [Gluconacetobacter liquefaciens]GBR01308.1 LysR family transcriptional regulator [Gluconacetobacter liquefaciens NRIC 0522]GEB39019.1 LysR family transcriptional regulator [Gluconacetobacter liquefaciens]
MDRYQAMATFVRVVETGSFSAAARQLNVGQPAVSKTIAQLETRLQVSLLIRSTHGLTPTEAGQTFYERARNAIQEADEAELAAKGAGAGLSGRLRVSAATTFARLHVIPRLPQFLAAHPHLDVDIILDDRKIDLVAEGVDISLRMGKLSDSTAVARKIATGGRSVLATPAYLARAGKPQNPADLANHEAIIYSQQPNVWSFTRDGAAVSVSVGGRLRVSAAEGLRAALLADMGLTIASDWMFAPELESGAIVRVLQAWSLPSIDLWAVFPAGNMTTAKGRQFAAFVEKIMRSTDT